MVIDRTGVRIARILEISPIFLGICRLVLHLMYALAVPYFQQAENITQKQCSCFTIFNCTICIEGSKYVWYYNYSK